MSELITAEEIKEIRGMYGLTQKSFAMLLGIGPASMVRYEQGAQPTKANANLIRAARHPEFMRECLERDGSLIPLRQSTQAKRVIYACLSLDSEEGEGAMETGEGKAPAVAEATGTSARRTMDEVYHYTIQQEVLNEQAANLACDLMVYLMNHNIDANDGAHPVSILLDQLLRLKRSLITEEADDDVYLEQVRGHLRYVKEFTEALMRAEKVA